MRQSPGTRRPRPLDSSRLEELALAYAARFSVSAARLEAYLARKLRERGWAGEGEAPVAAITARFVAAGYVDDLAYARARSEGLLRRGYGMRRVSQALNAAGIAADTREAVRADASKQRRAALALAAKRGFGPFGAAPPDRARREKQIAAMLRAGHPLDSARNLVDAPTAAEAETWAADVDAERDTDGE